MTAPPLAFTEDCCPEWGKLIGAFGWFSLEDHPHQLAMPCLVAGGIYRVRVNHCPVCGSHTARDAVVDRARVEQARAS